MHAHTHPPTHIPRCHQALSVPDSQFRAELRQAIRGALVPRWTEFYNKYSIVQFSKKNMDAYTRLSPAIVEEKLSELLTGL